MRAVLVLLALGLVAWVVFLFLPSSEVEGKVSGEEAEPIRFLERPEPGAGGEREEARETPDPAPAAFAPPAAAPAASVPPPREEPKAVFGLRASDAPSKGEEDVELARALLFGRPGDVERVLAASALPDAEKRFYQAFAEALAGNRKGGIELAQGLDDPQALPAEDRALLQAALSGSAKPTARQASTAESITRRALRLKLTERDAERQLADESFAEAALGYSELLLAALKGPWEPERRCLLAWTEGLNRAQAHHRWDPRGSWAGVEMDVQEGDSLTLVRKRFLAAHPDGLLCTGQIERANQISGYIHPGQHLRIPTERASTLVDLSSRWLLYMLGKEVAAAWEVGIGRDGQETILGTFRAADKQEKPTWFKRGQEPQTYPDNPLGTRWIAWERDGQKTGYGFHGTWEPESIGTAASDGCVRLRNEDVEVLFQILPVGAEIQVQE